MNPLVSIVIPTHNRLEEALLCLGAVHKLDYSPVEIIVVDNASSDDTPDRIAERWPDVRLVRLGENLGAVGGRNEGMRHARGEYFYFIDSDVIVEPGLLSELVRAGESDERIGVIGPRIRYYQSRKPYFVRAGIDPGTSRTWYDRDYTGPETVLETHHVPSTWMVKRKVVEEVGVMDTLYHTYYDESDWHGRVQRAGYRNVACLNAVAYHDVPYSKDLREVLNRRGTTRDKGSTYYAFHMARNRTLYMKKFASPLRFALFLLVYNNVFLLMYSLVFLRNLSPALLGAYIGGYFRGIAEARHITRIVNGTEDQPRLPLE